jgi:hypothetical protein
MNSFMSTIEEMLGVECSPELVVAAGKAHQSTLARISEAYSNVFDPGPYDLKIGKDYGGLVPYLPTCWSKQFHRRNGYMGMIPEDLDSTAAVGLAIERLKPMLLYSHAVAIDDPGAFLLGSLQDSDKANYQDNKQAFINYLEFMVAIKPLLDAGAVILLPRKAATQKTPASYPKSEAPGTYDTYYFDFAGVKIRFIQERGYLPGEEVLLDLLPYTESYLWSMTKMSAAHSGALDYYLPQVYWHYVLEEMLQAACKQMYGPHTQAPRLFSMQPLVDIHIPNLEALSYSDVVRLRMEEPALESWRTSLNEALSTMKTLEEDEMKFMEEPQDEIFSASVQLEEDISDSVVMGKAVRGTKQLLLGGVRATVANSMVLEELTSAHRAKLNAFGELLIEKKKHDPEAELLNFYVSIL